MQLLGLRVEELTPDYYIPELAAPRNKKHRSNGTSAAVFVPDKKMKTSVQLHVHEENFGISIPKRRLFFCFAVRSS